MKSMTHPKIKVAFVIPSGIGTGYTGPGIFLKRLITGSKEIVEPVLYAGLRTGHQHDPEFLPYRWMKFTNSSVKEQISWLARMSFWLIKDRSKYDVVHFHGTFFYSLSVALVCLFLRKPYVLVPLAANADISEKGKLSGNRFIKPLRRKIVENASHGFALGDSVAQELIAAGLPSRRVTSIYNPVSDEFFKGANPERFKAKHIVFIGTVGSLKRALLVVDVVAELRKRGLPVSCSFYGPFQEPSFGEKLEKKLLECDLSSVIQHVEFSNKIDEVLLKSATLFLLPSKQEGIPGALAEAMAAGVPCVVSDVGSMGEIIRRARAGRVISPTTESVADACEELLKDSELWHRESEKSRKFAVENFSSESIGRIYANKISSIT